MQTFTDPDMYYFLSKTQIQVCYYLVTCANNLSNYLCSRAGFSRMFCQVLKKSQYGACGVVGCKAP